MARYWFFWSFFVSASYVAWPNLAKAFNLDFRLLSILVVSVAWIVVIIPGASSLKGLAGLSVKAWVWTIIILLANAFSILVATRIAADKDVPTGMFLVTVCILQVIDAPLIDWVVNGTVPTSREFLGLVLSIPVLWLIAGPK